MCNTKYCFLMFPQLLVEYKKNYIKKFSIILAIIPQFKSFKSLYSDFMNSDFMNIKILCLYLINYLLRNIYFLHIKNKKKKYFLTSKCFEFETDKYMWRTFFSIHLMITVFLLSNSEQIALFSKGQNDIDDISKFRTRHTSRS